MLNSILKEFYSPRKPCRLRYSMPFGISLICICVNMNVKLARQVSGLRRLLTIMAVLMLVAARNDSATVDGFRILSAATLI